MKSFNCSFLKERIGLPTLYASKSFGGEHIVASLCDHPLELGQDCGPLLMVVLVTY